MIGDVKAPSTADMARDLAAESRVRELEAEVARMRERLEFIAGWDSEEYRGVSVIAAGRAARSFLEGGIPGGTNG